MIIATGLYLAALLLITVFTESVFGVNAQSLAYGPLTLALVVLGYLALTGGPRDFVRRWYTSSPLAAPGLLFLAGLAAALPLAHDVGLALKDFARWSFVWLVYAAVTRALCDRRDRCRLFTQATAAFVVLFAGLAAADMLTGGAVSPVITGETSVTAGGRFQSLQGNPGIFAGMLIVGFPLALTPALNARTRPRRLAWGVGAALIVAGMLLCGSRAALVAGMVSAIVVCALQRRWGLVAAIGAGVGLVIAALTLGTASGPPTLERLQETFAHTGSGVWSLRRRLLIWSLSAELIEERPLLGWGGAQLRFHQHAGFNRAHNAWLDAWLDGGLAALLAMVAVTWLIARRTLATLLGRCARYLDPTHVALVGSCCAVLTGWLVRAGIGGRIDWLPIFMLFGLAWERGGQRSASHDVATAATRARPAGVCGRDGRPPARSRSRGSSARCRA